MELSYGSYNNFRQNKRNSNIILNLKKGMINKNYFKEMKLISQNNENSSNKLDEEESEFEDEETRNKRKKQEYADSLIRLLTEPPKHKMLKKGMKLKPINQTQVNIDRNSSFNTHFTQESLSGSRIYSSQKNIKGKKGISKKLQEKLRKEKEKKENEKILKEIYSKQSNKKEIFRRNLDKLYGYNKKFLLYNAKLKKEKCTDLEKYQDDILKVNSINLCKDHMIKLSSDLKTIRIASEQIKPLPPINFRALVHHSLDESKPKKKQFGLRAYNQRPKEMDEFEKEMYTIKTTARHEKLNLNNNKLLYKMYEILPEYLVDMLYKKKGKY